MVGDSSCFSSLVLRNGKAARDLSSAILGPKYNYQFSMPFISSPISPMFHSPVLYSSSTIRLPLGLAFSSSPEFPQSPAPKIPSPSYDLPPPVNPPETVNPDPVTLRDQWKYATRLYNRCYSLAWGTAVLAGLSFFALGWWIKGENPVTGTHGEEEKEEEK